MERLFSRLTMRALGYLWAGEGGRGESEGAKAGNEVSNNKALSQRAHAGKVGGWHVSRQEGKQKCGEVGR